MGIKQSIWSLDKKQELSPSTLISEKELEDLIADNIELLSDDWLVIGRQVHTTGGGIIDLLCLDISGDTVIVELKRGMTPREVTAQAIDYASCVNALSPEELAQLYLDFHGSSASLDEDYTAKFGLSLDSENVNTNVQIVVVATVMDASTEWIINYLRRFELNINVMFFEVYQHQEERLLSRAWMVQEDEVKRKKAQSVLDWNGEFYCAFGDDEQRSWKDATRYGFVSAGGGNWYTNTLKNLEAGSRIWVHIPHNGYVGVAEVLQAAGPAEETVMEVDGKSIPFFDLELEGQYMRSEEEDRQEWVVKVKFLHFVPKESGVHEYGFFGNQNIVCRPRSEKWNFTIKRLKEIWKVE